MPTRTTPALRKGLDLHRTKFAAEYLLAARIDAVSVKNVLAMSSI
jgi:hypothetical protein